MFFSVFLVQGVMANRPKQPCTTYAHVQAPQKHTFHEVQRDIIQAFLFHAKLIFLAQKKILRKKKRFCAKKKDCALKQKMQCLKKDFDMIVMHS